MNIDRRRPEDEMRECEVIFARTLNQAVGLLIPDVQRNKKTIYCQPKLVSRFNPWAGGFQYTNWISSEEKAQYLVVLNGRTGVPSHRKSSLLSIQF